MNMNHFLLPIFLLYSLVTQYVLCAEDYPVISSGVYVGVRGSRLIWSADDDKFSGYLIGPSCGIDYRRPTNIYVGYRFYYMFGSIFDGPCKRATEIMNMQARLGYTFGKTLLCSPYFGLGIDIADFKRDHSKDACNHLAYTDINVPVGVVMTYHPSSTFSFGFDYQYSSEVDSYSRLGRFKNIRFELKEHHMHSVELPFQFSYPQPRFRCVQYRLIPFYRTYYYGSAKLACDCTCQTNATIGMPRQRAYEFGIRYEVAIW